MLVRLRTACSQRLVASRQAFSRRLSSTAPRDDGFTEALPSRDVIAPILCAGVYGFAWYMADEGRVQELAENVDVNTDPNAWPTANQVFHHLWPFAAGTLGMFFESAACKFSLTKDMDWLCKHALQDDTKAAVALCLITAPAEHSPAFVRAVFERGTMPRIKEIIQIYKTLRREEHDELLVNAAVLTAKAAALADIRAEGLDISDFVWMIPEDKAYLYAPYGLEGIACLWQDDPRGLLTSGGIGRVAELMDGKRVPFPQPTKAESSIANMELAERLMGRFVDDKEALLKLARTTEAELIREVSAAGSSAPKKTVWQRTGVTRGDSELDVARRVTREQLDSVRTAIAALEKNAELSLRSFLEENSKYIHVTSAAAFGYLYGYMRSFGRGWWQDVTPSVCRELSHHVALRSLIGSALIVGLFEVAPYLKKEAVKYAGYEPVTDYRAEGALQQLVAIDCAYLGAIAVLNLCFPYILVPMALNPTQLFIPYDVDIPTKASKKE